MDKNTQSNRARKGHQTNLTPQLRPEELIDGGLTAQPDDALEAKGVIVDESVFSQEASEADARRSGYIDNGEEPSPDNIMMNQ